jgi:pimeloyl-ACP methyl ester carboxylesterase
MRLFRWAVLPLLTLGTLEAQSSVTRFPLTPPDSGALAADLYGRGPRGVILIGHGGYSTRASWAPVARFLARNGFRVLVFETQAAIALRAGRETPCLYDAPCMARDVQAAIRYLRGLGEPRITLIGGSAGGGAAAEAASTAGSVERLVLLAPMAVDRPELVHGRKLVVVGKGDRGPGDRLRLPVIRDQYDRLPGPKQLVLLESSAHGQRLFDPPTGDSLRRTLLHFLQE